MKRVLSILAVVSCLLLLAGCGKTKVLHCDNCNKEVVVKESSNMEESWTIYCESCNEKLFGEDPDLGTK